MSEVMDILLVEDSPEDIELTRRALRRGGIVNSITVAEDGARALDVLFPSDAAGPRPSRTLPRLVILDLKLPKVNGLQVLEKIKADPRTRTIPVVVLTSSREEPDVARAYALGVNSYVVKPVEFEKFIEAVAQVGLYWLLLNEHPR